MKLDDIPFVIHDIQKEMPKHTETHVRIPHNYEMGLPKDFMKESEKLDNRYLNNHLHAIEEIAAKFPNHLLPTWMKDYQNKYFKANLAHDGFFKSVTDFESRLRKRQSTRPFIEFGKINGSTLEVGSDTSNSGAQEGILSCIKVTGGVVNTYYDQIAMSIITAAGNYRLALYSDNATAPNNVLSQSGSVTIPSGFTYTAIPEVALTTSTIWIAFQCDSYTARFWFVAAGAGSRQFKTFTYGSFPTAPAGMTSDTAQFHVKIGHS